MNLQEDCNGSVHKGVYPQHCACYTRYVRQQEGVMRCIHVSRRGLAALLILAGGQCESLEVGISKSTDSHVFCVYNRHSGERLPGGTSAAISKRIGYMVNIGELIHEKVTDKGLSVTWLAKRLNCSRTNVYKIFNRRTIDTGMLFRISIVLELDFFEILSHNLQSRISPTPCNKK